MGHNYNVIDIYHFKAFFKDYTRSFLGSRSVHFKPYNKKKGCLTTRQPLLVCG